MATRITINCENSPRKSVAFYPNGGNINDVLVFVREDNEFWFSLERSYKNLKNAKKAVIKKMASLGYTFNAQEMENLDWE